MGRPLHATTAEAALKAAAKVMRSFGLGLRLESTSGGAHTYRHVPRLPCARLDVKGRAPEMSVHLHGIPIAGPCTHEGRQRPRTHPRRRQQLWTLASPHERNSARPRTAENAAAEAKGSDATLGDPSGPEEAAAATHCATPPSVHRTLAGQGLRTRPSSLQLPLTVSRAPLSGVRGPGALTNACSDRTREERRQAATMAVAPRPHDDGNRSCRACRSTRR